MLGACAWRARFCCSAGLWRRRFDDNNNVYDGTNFATSNQTCPAGQQMRGIDASGRILCQAVQAVPAGMIAFFAGPCPSGFTEYTALRGRAVLGLPAGGSVEGTQGTALGDLGTREITEVPAHSHMVDPPSTNTSTSGAHVHSVDPPSVNTSTGGSHVHNIYTAINDTNNSSSQGYPNGQNHAAFRTTDRRQVTSGGQIHANGNHSHTVNVPAFNSASAGAHSHTVNISAFASQSAGSASVDVTMPYVQLRACVAL